MPEGGYDPVGSPFWSRVLAGPLALWREEPTLDQELIEAKHYSYNLKRSGELITLLRIHAYASSDDNKRERRGEERRGEERRGEERRGEERKKLFFSPEEKNLPDVEKFWYDSNAPPSGNKTVQTKREIEKELVIADKDYALSFLLLQFTLD
ncbi:hypothetical protein HGM15179_011263 [Zosterops borbonicus]|uniref:Uncharacterized protein n=1 Tax=Zosterops borbonicus TaxID=364589 RepID=A0A8K1LIY8_9PASS|nr:hypothetical protein HGM15179_011263 [Zosterops borbonicus]